MSEGNILDELIASTQRPTTTVDICGRGDLADRHRALVVELRAASGDGQSLAPGSEAQRISAEIVATEEEMAAATVTFTLQAASRRDWADLLAKHPPTPDRRKLGDDHNVETFPPAALAACTIQVRRPDGETATKITGAQATALSETLHAGEWAKLWDAVVLLNVAATPAPKLKAATELVRANGRSSTPSAAQSSPAPSSSAGGENPEQSANTTTPAG